MSKSILVIDTPKSCVKCPLKSQLYDIQYICCGNHKRMVIPSNKNKPSWCPLQEIPSKKNVRDFNISSGDFEQRGYQIGWNSCIDEVIGNYT